MRKTKSAFAWASFCLWSTVEIDRTFGDNFGMFDPSQAPATLAELAHRSFSGFLAQPCLGTKDKTTGKYKFQSYGEIAMRVRHATLSLQSLGLERGERAAILAENAPEWAIADLACQMNGIVSVPMFATLPASQVKTILLDCGAKLIFVSDAKQFAKIEAIRADLPELKTVVCFDAEIATADSGVLSFAQLEARGEEFLASNPTTYEMTWPAAQGGDAATIIYTSGTTGEPKGVVLSHRNIISNVEAIISVLSLSHADSFLSFLPLAHIYERTAGFYLPFRLGASIAYCESLFTVDKNLREAQPTIMFVVPRLMETMREKIASGAAVPEDKRAKFLDAIALAQKAGAARGKMPNAPGLSLIENIKYKLYDGAVYSKVREKFGGRLRAFVSGGAPLSPELGAFFGGLGVTVLEGYGLTETAPVIAVNRPNRVQLGTVGELVSSIEAKIADDGEICVRGASVFEKYWNKPEATAEALQNGWFHTGDTGSLENNYLKITGRKKDLLVLANGKKVAPLPIELKLSESRFIEQIVLLGDKQKAVSALIVPKLEAVREELKDTSSDDELRASAATQKLFRDELEKHSGDLADFEKIRKFYLLPEPFTVEGGELTPTLKVKRAAVAEKYAHLAAE
ncbi:MAG TPA: long-chain fatty acid--CoA ligase [Abditibacteriaceae bacterium]|jgi:long-chain acyl-CoA synthetase